MAVRERTRITYRYELLRSATAGIIETAGSTFLLTIAVRAYSAGALAKGFVAGGASVGLLLSPLFVGRVTRLGQSPSRAASRALAIGAVAFLAAAIMPWLPVFVLCSLIGMAGAYCIIPLLTHMYQENYPEKERGRLFSRTVMVRIAAAAGFSKLAGDALSGHIDQFRWLLVAFAMALGVASFCLARCPTDPIQQEAGSHEAHPLRALRFVRDDPLFRRTLVCWMLMGFANLMMLPLRVEYLANPRFHHGQVLTVGTVALLTGVIPNLARLVMSPIWGHLFDRMNFFALRVTLNMGFAIGILTFFASESFTGMVVGAIVFGISNAGGDVAWSLWVTKFAPPGRVADYMSAHTFLTGVRGVIAPMAAFYAVGEVPLVWLAIFNGGLIVIATALLIPEIKFGKRARNASALAEEVSE